MARSLGAVHPQFAANSNRCGLPRIGFFAPDRHVRSTAAAATRSVNGAVLNALFSERLQNYQQLLHRRERYDHLRRCKKDEGYEAGVWAY